MSANLVLRDLRETVCYLTLNHPEKRNALSRALLSELREQITALPNDKSVRAVIIRANGPVFSAGHDLREMTSVDLPTQKGIFKLCTDVMEGLRLLPQPVIAQVHGLATAAGCQLAASCDLVVASSAASFATPGVKIGLFCTTPAIPIVRAIPQKKALEMLFTGAPISAQEAERLGLVNRVAPPDQLEAVTWQFVQQILTASSATLAVGKRAYYDQLHLDYPAAYAAAQETMACNVQLTDAMEGMRAFVEKRPPHWRHE